MHFLMFFVFWVFFWGIWVFWGGGGGEESPQEIAGNNTGSFGRRAFAVAGSSRVEQSSTVQCKCFPPSRAIY